MFSAYSVIARSVVSSKKWWLSRFTAKFSLVVYRENKFDLPEKLNGIHDIKLGIDNEPVSFQKDESMISR